MAIIPQKQLFSWKEMENLGDLSRLPGYIRDSFLCCLRTLNISRRYLTSW